MAAYWHWWASPASARPAWHKKQVFWRTNAAFSYSSVAVMRSALRCRSSRLWTRSPLAWRRHRKLCASRFRADGPSLRGCSAEGHPASAASHLGQSDDARLRLFAAVSEFIRELAAAAPVALLLDDLHWADSASLGLLVHLARDLAADPVLLLTTYRDIDVGSQPALGAAVRDLDARAVAGQGERSRPGARGHRGARPCRASTTSRCLTRSCPSSTVARMATPFFIEEVLSTLLEPGPVRSKRGRAAGTSAQPAGSR